MLFNFLFWRIRQQLYEIFLGGDDYLGIILCNRLPADQNSLSCLLQVLRNEINENNGKLKAIYEPRDKEHDTLRIYSSFYIKLNTSPKLISIIKLVSMEAKNNYILGTFLYKDFPICLIEVDVKYILFSFHSISLQNAPLIKSKETGLSWTE